MKIELSKNAERRLQHTYKIRHASEKCLDGKNREMDDILRSAQNNARILAEKTLLKFETKEGKEVKFRALKTIQDESHDDCCQREASLNQRIEELENTYKGGPELTGPEVPEKCKLKAHHTGDGWLLYIENRRGITVAYLEWPKLWPEIISKTEIKAFGFEVEP